MLYLRYTVVVLLTTLIGCALAPTPQERLQSAKQLLLNKDWQTLHIPTQHFALTSFVPSTISKNKILTIYIEGDGLAWVTKTRASQNPTPVNPTGLKLALQHPNDSVAYLARPCQFVNEENINICEKTHWTDGRFSPEVIESINQAIETLRSKFDAEQIILVGYSGGGAIATLIAARRSDVIQLVTIAGNLNHRAWTDQHHISPLTKSLNPIDKWISLIDIKQIHFVGTKDTNINESIARSFQEKFPDKKKPEIKLIENFDHSCCWVEEWSELVKIWMPLKNN